MSNTARYMSCVRCYYAEPVYDKHGLTTGISCTAHNSQFIKFDDAAERYCGMFTERDD